jgi:ribosomal protein S12 methylthiotransferase
MNSQPKHRAYLKISDGCKKRCAFCAIPLIRGNLQSRQLKSVLSEAKLLVAGGVKELIVVSHDFTDFGWDLRKTDGNAPESPVSLLKALADESGAQWVRVLYLYPDGISDELVDLIASRPNLVKYFDMPLQHINDEMLKKMNRRMTRAEVEEAITRIRAKIPDAVIRTQFIVGFPGETEEQFQEMLEFVEAQQFDRVGCFMYSREEDTKAGEMPDQIDDEIKQRRHDTLMELQNSISRRRHQAHIGKRMQVLVEGYSEETELLLVGRNSQQAPEIDGVTYINEGTAQIGELVTVEITDAHDYDLVGRIVNPASPQ